MINENTRYDPKHCGLFKPGHKTHWVQCNVMRSKERFPPAVTQVWLSKQESPGPTEGRKHLAYFARKAERLSPA